MLADQENSGFLSLNQWLTAFDDLKVANLHSGDLKMLFGIFDLEKHCQLDYNVFLRELYGELPQNREQLVLQAFEHLARNGTLELAELKDCFNAQRHPEVVKGVKSADEVRFEFQNLFTSLHSANNNFNVDAPVSMNEFMEWHTILNTQIERDADFKELLVKVWSLDDPQSEEFAGGVQNIEIARQADRNAREMYRHDFHRVTFGN